MPTQGWLTGFLCNFSTLPHKDFFIYCILMRCLLGVAACGKDYSCPGQKGKLVKNASHKCQNRPGSFSWTSECQVYTGHRRFCVHAPLLPPLPVFLSLVNTVNYYLGKTFLSEVRDPWCLKSACLAVNADNFTWLWSSFLLGHGWKGEDRETGGVETADAYFIKVLWTQQAVCWEIGEERWMTLWHHISAFLLF